MPDRARFLREISRRIQAEHSAGRDASVNAGAVHRFLGGYPHPNHRIPTCCGAMRHLMQPGDVVTRGPDKGKGESFTVLYKVQ